jgi:hypothetical protein
LSPNPALPHFCKRSPRRRRNDRPLVLSASRIAA